MSVISPHPLLRGFGAEPVVPALGVVARSLPGPPCKAEPHRSTEARRDERDRRRAVRAVPPIGSPATLLRVLRDRIGAAADAVRSSMADLVVMSGSPPHVGVVGWPQKANFLLVAAWRDRGVAAELLDPARALARLGPQDVAVSRLDVLRTLDGVQPGLEAIDELIARGVRVVNGREALLAAHDKLITARLLEGALLPTPRTEHIAHPAARPEISPPLVVKPRFGSWGADVFRCETEAQLADVLHEVRNRPWFVKHGALVQELLPPLGHDLRLLVAASRVVGAVERVARPGEWRTNVSLGGTRRPAVPSRRACDLAVRAASATGIDFVGVDLFPVDDDYVVLELNGAAEFDNSYDLPASDVYQAAAEALALPRGLPRALDGATAATR